MLLDAGARVDIQDERGFTPLKYAKDEHDLRPHPEVIRLLESHQVVE